LKVITIFGGTSKRFPDAGCKATLSSLLRGSKLPNEGIETLSSCDPFSPIVCESPSIREITVSREISSLLERLSINVLLSIDGISANFNKSNKKKSKPNPNSFIFALTFLFLNKSFDADETF